MMRNKHRNELKLEWPLKKELMMSCEACSIGKERQLAVNQYVDNSKKAMKDGKRIFSDLATVKAPQDSGITTNRNWHIIVDQYTGDKVLKFYSTNNQYAKKIASGKIMENQYHISGTRMHQRIKS